MLKETYYNRYKGWGEKSGLYPEGGGAAKLITFCVNNNAPNPIETVLVFTIIFYTPLIQFFIYDMFFLFTCNM